MRKILGWLVHIFTYLSSNQSERLFCLILEMKATASQTVIESSKFPRLLCKKHKFNCLPVHLVFVDSL